MPADVILVRTTEKAGSCFIRTDQLDGETDWKLRLAVGTTQKLSVHLNSLVFQYFRDAVVVAGSAIYDHRVFNTSPLPLHYYSDCFLIYFHCIFVDLFTALLME